MPLWARTNTAAWHQELRAARWDFRPNEFNVLSRFLRDEKPFSVIEVHPLTGRKHQIRIHLAHLGHSIVGDKLYGDDENLYLALVENRLTEADRSRLLLPCHALHAASLRFPWKEGWSLLRAEPESCFKEFMQGAVQPSSDACGNAVPAMWASLGEH
jgi:23S rRNA-/tRNA-specific pseudouridylate synthase